MRTRILALALAALVAGGAALPAEADETANADQVDALQRRIEALAAQQAASQRELDALRTQLQTLSGKSAAPAPPVQAAAPESAPAPAAQAVVRKPTTEQSVDAIYQQQNALFTPQLTVTPSLTQIYSDSQYFTLNGFLALGAIFLGNANVTQQQSNVTLFNMNLNYGLSNRLQLELNAPYYWRETSFTSVGALGGSTSASTEDNVRSSGLGDISVGAFYQLQRESENSPSIVLNGHVYLPTGIAPYGIPLVQSAQNSNVYYPQSLPTGQGVYGLQLGGSWLKTVDPAILFGSVSYYTYLRKHFSNLGTDPQVATPGSAVPGNALAVQIGSAFSLNRKTSLSVSFQDTISQATRLWPDGGAPTTVIGSETNAAMLTFGTSYAVSKRQSVVTELGIGLTKDAPNFQFDVRMPTR